MNSGPIETHVSKALLEQLLLPLMGTDIMRVEITPLDWSDLKNLNLVPVKLYKQEAVEVEEEGTVFLRVYGKASKT